MIVFIGFVTYIGSITYRSSMTDYVRHCLEAPDEDCPYFRFFLAFFCVFYLGWELLGAFYLYAVYKTIKEYTKKGVKSGEV
ncbi:hypothetical protein AAVH_18622 [Aphelenchoides avenae]|nr:hypothetical protein AAVH_18622 [Aphelenchus avenae]